MEKSIYMINFLYVFVLFVCFWWWWWGEEKTRETNKNEQNKKKLNMQKIFNRFFFSTVLPKWDVYRL